ncbi:MAG: hypothetical protein JWN51_412 [Phycisphaerales bacterium]|nr:hypothetical protein [Phycisphaerales bacterium]
MNVSRVLAGMLLLLPAAFCAFGFLATFEQSPHAMLFRVGYAVVGLGLLTGAMALFVRAGFSRTRRIPVP